jgi:hypothetical protein
MFLYILFTGFRVKYSQVNEDRVMIFDFRVITEVLNGHYLYDLLNAILEAVSSLKLK